MGQIDTKQAKKQIHSSHLQMLWRCGIRFERVVIRGEREPAGIPLVVGSATHAVGAKNLTSKVERGTLLTREAVQDCARDSFVQEWQKAPVVFTDEEKEAGLEMTKGMAQDQTIALSLAYHYGIAPKIRPNRIERPWVLIADGYPFDISGKWDVDEDFYKQDSPDKEPKRIVNVRDTKTRKTNPGQSEVNTSDQYTLYAMAKYTLDGAIPDEVIQDTLVKPTKSREALAISYRSTRTKDDFQILFRRFETACMIIEKGIYTPANSYGFDSPCPYCGFFLDGSCKFVNSKRILGIQKKEEANGTKTKSTGDLIASLESAITNSGR